MCMFNGWPSVWLSVHVYACMYDLCVEDHLKYLFQSFSTVSMGFRLYFKNPEPNSLSLRFSHSGLCVSASQNAVALARHCGAIACLVCPCILIVFVRSLVRWFVMPLCFCCSRRRRRCVACMAPATAKPSENSEHTDSLLDYSDQKYKYLLVNNTVEWMFETGRDARRSAVATEKKKHKNQNQRRNNRNTMEIVSVCSVGRATLAAKQLKTPPGPTNNHRTDSFCIIICHPDLLLMSNVRVLSCVIRLRMMIFRNAGCAARMEIGVESVPEKKRFSVQGFRFCQERK